MLNDNKKVFKHRMENLKLTENISEIYSHHESKYLEVLYFQILRNSKEENFSINCLLNFMSSSEFITSKIFKRLDKGNKSYLSLSEFTIGVSLLFSRFFPFNGKVLTDTIFSLLTDENDPNYMSFDTMKEFINNLLFDVLNKGQIFNFDFYYSFAKKIENYAKEVFSIDKTNLKTCKFSKKDFLKIIKQYPKFLNLIILLLNFISPINEKFIYKLTEKSINIYPNDDFEDEIEIEYEETPRVNCFPEINNKKVFYFSNFDFSCEEIDNTNSHDYFLNKNYLSGKIKKTKTNLDNIYNDNSLCLKYNNTDKNLYENENKNDPSTNENKRGRSLSCNENNNVNTSWNINVSFQKIKENFIKPINDDVKAQALGTKTPIIYKNNSSDNSINELSTDNSDLAGNKQYEKKDDLSKELFKNLVVNNQKLRNENFKNLDDNNNYNLIDKFSDNKIEAFEYRELNEKSNSGFSDKNKNSKLKTYKMEEIPTCKNLKEYNLGDVKNEHIPIRNFSIIKGFENDSEFYNNIKILYKTLKNAKNSKFKMEDKFQLFFSKNPPYGNIEINKENKIIQIKNFLKENKLIPFNLKIIDNDLIFYHAKIPESDDIEKCNYSNKNSNKSSYDQEQFELINLIIKYQKNLRLKKDSVYLFNLKNLIISPLPEELVCKREFIFESKTKNMYALKIFSFNQSYDLYFSNYEELKRFHNITCDFSSNISRPTVLNSKIKNKFDFIIKNLEMDKSYDQKMFSAFHELVDIKSKFSMKIQTLKKEYLNKDTMNLFNKIFDTCKLNNLIKFHLFPISNIYEYNNYIIIEYSNDPFRVSYDKKLNNYTITVKSMEISEFLRNEVVKFKKLGKLLNKKELISLLFSFIDLQSTFIFGSKK